MFWCKWHNMLHVNNIVMLCMDLCFLCLSLCVFMFWCKWKEEDSSGVSRQQKAISRPTYHTLAYLATTEYHYNICSKKLNICAISMPKQDTFLYLATSQNHYNIYTNHNICDFSIQIYSDIHSYNLLTNIFWHSFILFMIPIYLKICSYQYSITG